MIETIVVPLDGSLTAEAILPQLRRLLNRNDSEVILLRAVQPPVMENEIMLDEAELAAAREYLLGQKEKLSRQGVRVRHRVEVGSPTGVILDVVKSEKAGLVALATHGATGLKRLLLGSVAEDLIRKSPVPVLLVRPFWSYDLAPAANPERRPIRNLLLPVDAGGLARQALPGALQLAELFEARIVLLKIFEDAEEHGVAAPEKRRAEEELEVLAKIIEKKGVETLRLLGTGKPVERILETVREQKIDLIAMATHGRTGWSRATAGSVTEEVLRRAEVPLLVTRASELAKKPGILGRTKARK